MQAPIAVIKPMQAPIAVIKRVMKHQTEGGDRRLCQGLCAQPGD